MQQRHLGRSGPMVSALGLGCMAMSGMYGPADRTESIATIHAALDAGVNLLDTGDFYGMGHNEMLIGEALRGIPRDRALVSVAPAPVAGSVLPRVLSALAARAYFPTDRISDAQTLAEKLLAKLDESATTDRLTIGAFPMTQLRTHR